MPVSGGWSPPSTRHLLPHRDAMSATPFPGEPPFPMTDPQSAGSASDGSDGAFALSCSAMPLGSSTPMGSGPMFGCLDTVLEMQLYLDAETSAAVRESVDLHLSGCPDCQGAFEFHHDLKRTIAAKCRTDDVPSGLRDRILNCFGPDFLS
jgi:mycothiol system anti-sigma-R factor